MTRKPCRIFLPVLLLLLACPFRPALAAFNLPEGASIDVKPFDFPAFAAGIERDLPARFHDQIVFALHRAGFAVPLHGDPATPLALPDAGSKDAVRATGEAEPEKNPDSSPLEAAPLTETPPPGQVKEVEIGEQVLAPPAEKTARKTEPAPFAPETPQPVPVPAPNPAKAAYILTGQVTLLREDVGAPRRIGGGIRIRAESSMHAAFRIIEAATGNVLISDVVSDSATRIASDTGNIDAALAALTERIMASCAAKIAARLSGTSVPQARIGDDREQYQDSPGKRLRPAPVRQ